MTTDNDLERRIRDAAGEMHSAAPSAHQLEVILARRDRGDRVVIPGTSHSRAALPLILPLLAVAASVLFLIVFLTRSTRPARDDEQRLRAGLSVLAPTMLAAQGSARPSFAEIGDSIGLRLRPGLWLYSKQTPDSMVPSSDTLDAYSITRTEYAGKPAWLLLEGTKAPGHPPVFADSTWVSRGGLEVLSHRYPLSPDTTLEEIYQADQVRRGVTTRGHTSWTAVAIDTARYRIVAGANIGWVRLLAVLQAVELSPTWESSVSTVGIPESGTAGRRWIDLKVYGEGAVVVPAGRYDCWKVSFSPRNYGFFFWVSKDGSGVVQRGMADLRDRRYGNMNAFLVRREQP
jgi:hypothetical protein